MIFFLKNILPAMFIQNYSCCYSEVRVGIILMFILVTCHAQILDLVVYLWDKGVLHRERLRKGCNFSIMNFRDMGAFQNFPDTHVNIGFYQSEPPGVSGIWANWG